MRRLEDGGHEETAREVIASLGLREAARPGRPRVAAAMIAAADGHATIDGKSVKLGHPEDRALLRELRTGVDCVLAGTATLIAEGYANLLDDDQRELREQQGVAPHPVLATIDRRGGLGPDDVPIFAEPGVPIAIYSEQPREIEAEADAHVHALGEGGVTFQAVLEHLAEHYGVKAVSCEGGPKLLRELVARGCLDELLLTVAPLLVAGDGPASLVGDAFGEPPRMTLADVRRAEDHLFLHYRL